jgi:choline monooxygenase
MKLPHFIKPEDLKQAPIERAETIPSAWYTEPEMLFVENALVFKREWQLAGHLSQLVTPGSSIELTISGNPVLIVPHDGKDGNQPNSDGKWQDSSGNREMLDGNQSDRLKTPDEHHQNPPENQHPSTQPDIRAFYNVCKHRGGPLSVKCGTKSVIQCQYHGWTYKTDGSLRGVPHFNHVELFDKKDFGLKPIPVHIWEGLIFVSLSENPRPFDQIVDGIANRIAPIVIADMKFHTRTIDIIDCNWKVYVDNYLEGYHIPIVHPELAKMLDYSQYVTETAPWYSLQYSPFASSDTDNPYNVSDGEAFYYFIYPNIMLNILPGRLQTNIIEPMGPDKCRVIFDFYYTDVDSALSSGTIANDLQYSAEVQQEDIEICEAVHRGLHSDAYDKGRFSVERELGVYHFQSLLKNALSAK